MSIGWAVDALRDERMKPFWDLVDEAWKSADSDLRSKRDISFLRGMEVIERIRAIPDKLEGMRK